MDYAKRLFDIEKLKHERKMLEPFEQWGNLDAETRITEINTRIKELLREE